MRHVKISINQPQGEQRDMLVALLAEGGFDGFEENDTALYAFIPEAQFSDAALHAILTPLSVGYTKELIEPQNWNEIWESSFQPVVVDGFCTVRAHFHEQEVTTPYCVVITPKMSFGTGHHATTQLMIMAMREIPFAGTTVLDFGTGTGVLAILAAKLGATNITAIDNDSWSVENAIENAGRNDVGNINIFQASIEDIGAANYDVILANINRHILLEYMGVMYERLTHGGRLLMSGLLTEDEEIITAAALQAGLTLSGVSKLNGWISIQTVKQ